MPLIIKDHNHLQNMITTHTLRSFQELMSKLLYLHNYGGEPDGWRGRSTPRMRVVMHPGTLLGAGRNNFDLAFERWEPAPDGEGEWKHWMSGGLVYHHSDDSWGVHT